MAVSLVDRNYNVTEGTDMSIDVCVEIITGQVSQMSTVEIETDSGSATCKLRIYGIYLYV